jgi:Fe-Mn family superoxide dismutase
MYTLPNLPYSIGALEPHISRETLEYHYGIHHRTYVTKLNELIGGSKLESLSLPELVVAAHKGGFPQAGAIFNNAAQAWNHGFYWQCLTPRPARPGALTRRVLDAQFGSVEEFQRRFTRAALDTFGSGWTWLVGSSDGRLDILSTGNAHTPVTGDGVPLLTCDVWEHAYYIDYRNARAEYLEAYWKILNWAFVEANLVRLHETTDAA